MARNAGRLVAGVLAVTAILGVTACNYTDGPCYRREDIEGTGSDGAGGGPIVPGWGGYGDVPPDPQNTTDPEPVDCNKTEQPDEQPDTQQPDEGDNSNSCGNSSVDTLAGEETYAYCSGACKEKCPTGGVNGFSPSVFKFSTTLPDTGEGEAGGWQVASGTLNFFRWTGWLPESWTCTVTVGMALRTVAHGKVSAETAATVTASVASQASFNAMKIKPELPPGIFCATLKEEMRTLFKQEPLKSHYGARVMSP